MDKAGGEGTGKATNKTDGRGEGIKQIKERK